MPFTDWSTGDVITATKLDNDNTVSLGTDTSRTCSVTHTWTAPQTFTQSAITASAPFIDSTTTWNSAGVTFTHFKVNLTDTASASASKFLDFQVSGTPTFYVLKGGSCRTLDGFIATLNYAWFDKSNMSSPSDGVILFRDNAGTSFTRLQFGGTTSSFPSLKRSTTTLQVRLADDSAYGGLAAAQTILDQGAADDAILDMRSSDVGHGVTTIADTTSFATFAKNSGSIGGLIINGLADSGSEGMVLRGIAPTDNTAKSTAALGYVEIYGSKVNGTGLQTPGADANLAVITANGTTQFIFDVEGSGHANVEWTTF